MPVEGKQALNQNTTDRYTRAGLPEFCGQQNVRATVRDNTGQNTKEHTQTHPGYIKIPDPVGNRTQATRLEDRDYNDYATAKGCINLKPQ